MITAYAAGEERGLLSEAWTQEGILEEFLRKPVDPDELINAIEKHAK